jgi:hypothetical protein
MGKITVTLVKIESEKDIEIDDTDNPVHAIDKVVRVINISDGIQLGEYFIIASTPKTFINFHLIRRIRVGYFDEKTKIWKKETPA